MQQGLADADRTKDFLENIRSLIAQGYASRALALLHDWVRHRGYDDIAEMMDPKRLAPRLQNWKTARTHCAGVSSVHGRQNVLSLELVLRSSRDQTGQVQFVIRGSKDKKTRASGPSEREDAPQLAGIDELFAYAHQSNGSGVNERMPFVYWSIIACFVKAVLDARAAEPLPGETALMLRPDYTPRSMECGFVDLLPAFNFSFEPEGECPPNAAEQLRQERADKNRADFQQTWVRIVAETREIHRMLPYFPFYRFRGRNELGGLWESQLKMACRAVDLDPLPKISWRMSGQRLQEVLRQILEAKNIPDTRDALDPRHTDRLHDSWLKTAKAADFRLGAGFSMFQLQLASALHKGGPWVEDRWEHAKPYAEEHKLG